jgi:hypothetical protein
MLRNLITEINEVVSLEIQDLYKLEGDKLETFKKYIKAIETSDIFFGLSNLVITSVDDFNMVKLIPKLEIVLKLEVPEYNYFVYVTRYHNNEFLSNLLTVPHTETV